MGSSISWTPSIFAKTIKQSQRKAKNTTVKRYQRTFFLQLE